MQPINQPAATGQHARTAVVTGAAGLIGRATARTLHQRGYDVFCWDVDERALAKAARDIDPGLSRIHVQACDVSDPRAVEAATARVARHSGALGVLVNNAMSWQPSGPLSAISAGRWSADIAMLLTSYQDVYRSVHGLMRRGSAVVNMASVHGLTGSAGWGTYDVCKAAIIQWTRVLAEELGPSGIRANAIAPGIIASDALLRSYAADPALHRLHATAAALHRVGTGADVAEVVAFLASEASGFITGQTIAVDGGMSGRLQLTAAETAVAPARRDEQRAAP